MSAARDIVEIQGLRVDTVIGVHDWERGVRQTLVIDLELATDVRAAGAQDKLADALDYDAVAKRVTALVAESSFQLIESVAEAVAAMLQREFGIRWLRVSVSKPGAVANARSVSVRIERGVG